MHWRCFSGLFGAVDTEQRSDLCDACFAYRAGQEAVVADAVEAIGQNVDQEAADELRRSQAHDLLPVTTFDAIVFPTESHEVLVGADKALV